MAECELFGVGVRNNSSSRKGKTVSMRSKLSDLPSLTSSFKLSTNQRRSVWAFVAHGGRNGVWLNQSVSTELYETIGIADSEHVGQRFRNGPTCRIRTSQSVVRLVAFEGVGQGVRKRRPNRSVAESECGRKGAGRSRHP